MDVAAAPRSSALPAWEQRDLRTPRLRLREFRADDAAALFEVHSDPAVMRYWSFPAWTRPEQAAERVRCVLGQRARGEVLAWVLAEPDGDRLVGSIAVFALDRANARAEIGYSLRTDRQGQGLAQEAMRAVLAFLFDELGIERVEADVDPRNVPSCRLLERLGFRREGLLRARWRVAGEVCDSALYGLLASDPRAA
jgi:RimJ/RimL family protein N-acetyltransferase